MKLMKGLLRAIIQKSEWIRKIIYKLHAAAFSGESSEMKYESVSIKPVAEKRKTIFTKKATYTGYSIDYLNNRFLTKEERICELKQLFYNHCGYYLLEVF